MRNEARRLGFRFRELELDTPTERRAMIGVVTTDIYGRFILPLVMGIEEAFDATYLSRIKRYARPGPGKKPSSDATGAPG